jgi:ABC-type lipoprotein export system ATPase subunit
MKEIDPTAPMISARQLTRLYQREGVTIVGVQDLKFTIDAGAFVVIKGASGSGKSTLLAMMAGLDRPSSGSLKVAGYDIGDADDRQLTHYRRHMVGMVFQSFNLLPTLSVFENTCLPALLSGQKPGKAEAKAMTLLETLGMMKRREHFPIQLSGGEMQRNAIARALINDPKIILADEPTGNLDSRNSQKVLSLLADLHRQGQRTVIVATHSRMADSLATQTISLQDGKIQCIA